MRKILLSNYLYLILLGTIILSSCETEGVSRISFDNDSFALRVGQSDTLVSTISFTGDIGKFPVEWAVQDPTVISIVETTNDTHSKTSGLSSVTKSVIITALKAGSTALTINTGGKTHSCQVTVTQQSLTFNQAFASNWGDYYDTGTNNFYLTLLESTINQNFEGNGNILYLDIFLPLSYTNITTGDFEISEEGEIYTFLYPGYYLADEGPSIGGAYLEIKNGEDSQYEFFQGGSFSINKQGNNFEIVGELLLYNNEIITFSYNGIVNESDRRSDPININPDFTTGTLEYYGDAYNTGNTNNFALYLQTDNIDSNNTTMSVSTLMLEFNTDKTVKDYIPEGEYKMMMISDELKPFSMVFGYWYSDEENYYRFGSWFFGESILKLNAGKLTVLKNEDIYTINYEFYDRIGSKVWGTYNGPLTYIDGTQEVSANAPAKVKGVKSTKSLLNKKEMLKNKKRSDSVRKLRIQ
jgi:hypothetical protein